MTGWDLETVAVPWKAFTLRCNSCHKVAAHWVVDSEDRRTPEEILRFGSWHRADVRTPCDCVWGSFPALRPGDLVKASKRGPGRAVVAGAVVLRAAP